MGFVGVRVVEGGDHVRELGERKETAQGLVDELKSGKDECVMVGEIALEGAGKEIVAGRTNKQRKAQSARLATAIDHPSTVDLQISSTARLLPRLPESLLFKKASLTGSGLIASCPDAGIQDKTAAKNNKEQQERL